MEHKYKKVKVVVTKQGGPLINKDGCFIMASGAGVKAVMVDMKSKECDVFAVGNNKCPQIYIDGRKGIHLKKGRENKLTEISFPELKGWDIWCSEISRYTLYICFVRKNLC